MADNLRSFWEGGISIDTIEKNQVVAFSYLVTDETGAEVEKCSVEDPMVYLHGHANILPALERALAGKSVGEEISTTLAPEQAYGFRRDDGIQRVPIKHLVNPAKRLKPGMLAKVNTRDGMRDVTIIKVGKFNVDVDTNHPFAGKTLTFNITVQNVREPTSDELTHRHAHGVSGDAHH